MVPNAATLNMPPAARIAGRAGDGVHAGPVGAARC